MFLVVKFYTELLRVSFVVDCVERAAQRALRLFGFDFEFELVFELER